MKDEAISLIKWNVLVSGNEAGEAKKKSEILSIKPEIWGVSVDLKALYKNLVSKN